MSKYLSAIQAAELIGVSRTTIYDWKREGPPKGLRHGRIGEALFFTEEWINESERARRRMAKGAAPDKSGASTNEESIQHMGGGGDR